VSYTLTIQIEPHVVLGVAIDAPLHEIREAYRRKAMQHHPDRGGEDWAFRIVSQSYEVLSTARVVQATQTEFRSRSSRPTASTSASAAGPQGRTHAQGQTRTSHKEGPGAAAGGHSESVRPGVQDAVRDPTKVVDVEKLWVRFEVDHLWLLQDGSHEDRFLSCSLNISWPDPELASRAESIPDAEETLRHLTEVFNELHTHTPVTNSRCKVDDHKFQGWLCYPSTQLAWNGFNKLHEELNARGLAVKAWTRDLIIPRDWR
jgi:curved DNA-binding protein CbpA